MCQRETLVVGCVRYVARIQEVARSSGRRPVGSGYDCDATTMRLRFARRATSVRPCDLRMSNGSCKHVAGKLHGSQAEVESQLRRSRIAVETQL